MTDILDEIAADIKREKYAKLWKQYANYVIGAILAALIGAILYNFNDNYQKKQSGKYGDMLLSAQKSSNPQIANEKYNELIKNGNAAYKALASLDKAELAAGSNADTKNNVDKSSSIAAYKELSENSGAPKIFRDLAKIAYYDLQLDSTENKDPKAIIDPKLAENSVFKFSMLELTALDALKSGNNQQAKEILQKITADIAAPAGIKRRAELILSRL